MKSKRNNSHLQQYNTSERSCTPDIDARQQEDRQHSCAARKTIAYIKHQSTMLINNKTMYDRKRNACLLSHRTSPLERAKRTHSRSRRNPNRTRLPLLKEGPWIVALPPHLQRREEPHHPLQFLILLLQARKLDLSLQTFYSTLPRIGQGSPEVENSSLTVMRTKTTRFR